MIGADPAAELAAAVTAFATGDTVGATSAAERADALVAGAPEVGRTRIIAGGGLAAGGILIAAGAMAVVRRRRRDGAGVGPAPAAAALPDAADSYVTLGAPPADAAGQEPAAAGGEEET